MSTYKLIYFNLRARGEVARLIFAQAGVDYEDKRIPQSQEWLELKPNTPTGVLPILEVDGKQLTGNLVIQRFLAERLGLAGTNDVENAEIAGIVDVLEDFWNSMLKAHFERDAEKKAKAQEKFVEEEIPKYWGVIDKMAEKNNSAEGWIYGNKPTYADLGVFHMVDFVLKAVPTFLSDFPHVAKIKAAVEALPNVAAWVKKRPETHH